MDKPKVRNTLNSKKLGVRNRRKGHNYERELAKEFRDIGFERCRTTRESSKLLDSCKIDLDLPDLNVQAKNVIGGVNYLKVFALMDEHLKLKIPERLDLPKVIFHKRKGRELVIIEKDYFFRLLIQLNESDEKTIY